MASKKHVTVITKKKVVNKDAKDDKMARVMGEFKAGTLKSNGKVVTDYDQALAIALSEAGLSYKSLYQSQLANRIRVLKSQTERLLLKEIERDNHINSQIENLLINKSNFNHYAAAQILGISTREFMFRCIGVAKSIMVEKAKEVPQGTVHTWSDGTKHRKTPGGDWELVTTDDRKDTGEAPGKNRPPAENKKPEYMPRQKENEPLDKEVVNYDLSDFNKFVNSRDTNIPVRWKPWLTTYSEKEYDAMKVKTFLSDDGKSGCAVAPDGDIISVFSGGKGRIKKLINTAIINGGNHLDCIGDKLASLYEEHGFEIYKTEPWNDQYAPPGWDYVRDGRPRIYFMKLKKELQTMVQMSEDIHEISRETLRKMDETLVPEQTRRELDQYIAFLKGEGDLPPDDQSVEKAWPAKRSSTGWHDYDKTGNIVEVPAPKSRQAHTDEPSAPREAAQQKAPAVNKAQLVKSQPFKSWFGDWEGDPAHASKVVKKSSGEPQETAHMTHAETPQGVKVVYHGTPTGGFEAFDKSRTAPGLYGHGFYFTEDKNVAEGYATSRSTKYKTTISEEQLEKIKDFLNEHIDVFKTGLYNADDEVTAEILDEGGIKKLEMVNGHGESYEKIAESGDNIDVSGVDPIVAYMFQLPAVNPRDDSLMDTSIRDDWDKKRQEIKLKTERVDTSNKIYECYLNIRQPFDVDNGFGQEKKMYELIAKHLQGNGYKYEIGSRTGPEYGPGTMIGIKDKDSDIFLINSNQYGTDQWGGLASLISNDGVSEMIKSFGYDGLTHIGGKISGGKPHRVWIAFEPTQIKATDNAGTFNPQDPNIKKSMVYKSQKWQHTDGSWWWHNPNTGAIEQTRAPGPREAAADTTAPEAHGFRESETTRVLDAVVRSLSTNNFATASSILNGYLIQLEEAGRITRVQREALEQALSAARDNHNDFRSFNLTAWLKMAEGQGQGNAPVSGTIASSAEFDDAQFKNMRDQVLDAGSDTNKVKRLLREYLADQYAPGTARDSIMKKMYQKLQRGTLTQADLDAMKNDILTRSLAGHLFRRGMEEAAAGHESTRQRRTRTAPATPAEPAIDPDTGEPVGAAEEPAVPGTRIGLTQTDEAFLKEFRSTNLKYRKLIREGKIEEARDLLIAYIKKQDFFEETEKTVIVQGVNEKFSRGTLTIDVLTKTKKGLIRRRDQASAKAQEDMSVEDRFKHYLDAGDKDNASKELIRNVQNRTLRPYQLDIFVAEALALGTEFNYKDFQKRASTAEDITGRISNGVRDAHAEYFDWLSGLPEAATQGLRQRREFEQAWAMNHYIDSNSRKLTPVQQTKLKNEVSEAMLNHYTGFKPKKFIEAVDKHVAVYDEAKRKEAEEQARQIAEARKKFERISEARPRENYKSYTNFEGLGLSRDKIKEKLWDNGWDINDRDLAQISGAFRLNDHIVVQSIDAYEIEVSINPEGGNNSNGVPYVTRTTIRKGSNGVNVDFHYIRTNPDHPEYSEGAVSQAALQLFTTSAQLGARSVKCQAAGDGDGYTKEEKIKLIMTAEGMTHEDAAKRLKQNMRRTGSYCGYITWAKFGFNQDIQGSSVASRMTGRTGPTWTEEEITQVKRCTSVQDIIDLPKGPEIWERYGFSLSNAVFDLTPGSRSLRQYEKYMQFRARRAQTE